MSGIPAVTAGGRGAVVGYGAQERLREVSFVWELSEGSGG